MMRTSSQWRDLPIYYGKWRSVHKRWESWSRQGIINQTLSEISRDYDGHVYKERHLIECFFNKIKQFRRVFSHFEKKTSSFMAFLSYPSLIIWLR